MCVFQKHCHLAFNSPNGSIKPLPIVHNLRGEKRTFSLLHLPYFPPSLSTPPHLLLLPPSTPTPSSDNPQPSPSPSGKDGKKTLTSSSATLWTVCRRAVSRALPPIWTLTPRPPLWCTRSLGATTGVKVNGVRGQGVEEGGKVSDHTIQMHIFTLSLVEWCHLNQFRLPNFKCLCCGECLKLLVLMMITMFFQQQANLKITESVAYKIFIVRLYTLIIFNEPSTNTLVSCSAPTCAPVR